MASRITQSDILRSATYLLPVAMVGVFYFNHRATICSSGETDRHLTEVDT